MLRLKVSTVKVMIRFKQMLREQRRKLSYLLSDFCQYGVCWELRRGCPT